MTEKPMPQTAFPLCWPVGWKRSERRKYSMFGMNITLGRARDELYHELKLMGVRDWNIILSTNIPLRRDGLPYSGQANPGDPGCAVYFRYKEKPMVFACDTYIIATDNVWAVRKTIEALRGIQRWGASDMMERSFTGFEALPAPAIKRHWWEVLSVNKISDTNFIKDTYKRLAMKHHPDRGGDVEIMKEINQAWAEFQKERGL